MFLPTRTGKSLVPKSGKPIAFTTNQIEYIGLIMVEYLRGSKSLFVYMFVMMMCGSASATIIPTNRVANWASGVTVGVPGGIPHRTNIFMTLSAGASAATIQSAINSCPSNQVVLLGPGSYNIASTLNFGFGKNGISLRGSGPSTILHNTGGSYIISLGAGANWNTANYPPTWDAGVGITSGNTQGSS